MRVPLAGIDTYVYSGGRSLVADAPTVVFLHGAANDHSVWSLQSRWFAHHGFNVMAPDLPGHGRSGGDAIGSIEQLADWTLSLIDALALREVHLVGHSMGSLIALETAARQPARVQSLCLVGCAVPMAVSDALLIAAQSDEPSAIRMITNWSHAPSSLLAGGHIPGVWLPGVTRALMARADQGVLHRDLLNCREYSSGLDAASRVVAPTLLLVGDRDLMTPRKALAELKPRLTLAQEVVITDAGHAMMNEQPDQVLDALHRFIRNRGLGTDHP